MKIRLLPCLCLLLHLLHGQALSAPEPRFMLLVPSLLHAGSPEQVCVALLHLNETISLNVVLEAQAGNVSLLQMVIANPNAFQCMPFHFPKLTSSEVAYITLHGKGESLEFKGKRSVLLQPKKNLVFVQTDKHIYKPGQKIQFRVVVLDEGFHPVNETIPMIYIEDPQLHRVNQWRDVVTGGGIAQLSFPLASEPLQGTYKVVIKNAGASSVEHFFKVQEYVLPKFEVLVTLPKKITILDEELRVEICGLYTYGKPVAGMMSVSICRRFSSSYFTCGPESDAICEKVTRKANPRGCLTEVVPTKIFQLKRTGYEMEINVQATLTEEGTGVELTGEGSCEVTNTMAKVTFVEVGSIYQQGIPFFGQVQLEDTVGAPLANEPITLLVEGKTFNYTTDQHGQALFFLNTSSFTSPAIHLKATYRETQPCDNYQWLSPVYEIAHHSANRVRSMSQSYLKLEPKAAMLNCDHEERVTVHYILTPEGLGEAEDAKLYFLVMAKGGIVRIRSHTIKVEKGVTTSGSFVMPLPISAELAPLTNVLIIAILPNGEVIADKTSFKIAKCFDNKVKLAFSSAEGHPASNVSLQLEAAPGSLCALRAVDKSVILMAPKEELSAEKVYSLLHVQELSGYYHEHHDLEEPRDDPCIMSEPIFLNGLYYSAFIPEIDSDAYQILKAMGLKVLTNAQVRTPIPCQTYNFRTSDHLRSEDDIEYLDLVSDYMLYHPGIETPPRLVEETIRKYFPETWLWDILLVDSSGRTKVPLTIPDTITEWKAAMFCMAEDAGFGLSPTVSLTAFQPFFLELTLPYSVIRGEAFTLKATVFNYLSQCIRMRIVLQDSTDFHAELPDQSEETHCLCDSEQKTISWPVTPKALGEVNFTVSAEAMQEGGLCGNQITVTPTHMSKDTIIKPLLVEPEGVEKEVTHNALICAAENPVPEKISLRLPEKVVEGSARAYYTVLGDLLGTAMQNLDKLLQMPYGCGEQNMVLFTPNIYILEYLNKTGQLTKEIKSRAIGYLTSGYQRQLTYMDIDGSYSAFGPMYGEGNTWLTAFVLKSFARARSYIFIEEAQISESLQWLSEKQKSNGCFRSVGQLFNNAMKGGVDDEVTLSAYITIALLEYPLPMSHPVVRNALFCLETASKDPANVYIKALLSYAFTLAGAEQQRTKLLESLEAEAVYEDGSVHWQRRKKTQEETEMSFFYHRAPSAEVEMTSYVLLARLSKQPVSQEDLTEASKIVKWITKQQNPNGGFSSTQDTVVALQALSVYGAIIYTKNGESRVTVFSDRQFNTEFHVDDGNRLLLQRTALPDIPGDYSVVVQGNGCIYMQMTLRYNIPHPSGDSPFHLSVSTVPDTCKQRSQKMFDISVNASYIGKRPISNMVLVDVKMVSGFIPVKSSTNMLLGHPVVRRTETKPNHVVFYLENLTKQTTSFSFSVEQEILVKNLQPATVKIYDYYETDEYMITEYSAPCSTAIQRR